MQDSHHYYRNGEITVLWQPLLCQHSGKCFRGLPAVFDPRRKPWIMLGDTPSMQIIEQVHRCPSGALSIFTEDAQKK